MTVINIEHAIGALVGSAVGDALGAPFEFQRPGLYRATFPTPVLGGAGEMQGGGSFNWRPAGGGSRSWRSRESFSAGTPPRTPPTKRQAGRRRGNARRGNGDDPGFPA